MSPNLEDVTESVAFMRMWGQDYEIDNLQWTEEVILNSCDETLSNKIKEQYRLLPRIKRGGPTAFFIMMSAIVSSTELATRALLSQLSNMKINELPGENVNLVISRIRGALIHLESIRISKRSYWRFFKHLRLVI